MHGNYDLFHFLFFISNIPRYFQYDYIINHTVYNCT